jgi:hypothetical protein
MHKNGLVEPSYSPWSSPPLLVKKKDGTWRFCVDYRELNNVTKKDKYPLPRIDDALDPLGKSRYFTTLDLACGYWQIPVAPEDREKTAFSTQRGHFQRKVMPFGLTNAPATFQRMMDVVLSGLTWRFCLVYLDDIIVYSETFEKHLQHLKQVFERLREANLHLKAQKCHFCSAKVSYLGHVITPEGISPDPAKVSAILEAPPPKNTGELRSFLGLTGYYRRFIKGYAHISYHLSKLLSKDEPWVWSEQYQPTLIRIIKRTTYINTNPGLPRLHEAIHSVHRCERVRSGCSSGSGRRQF